MTNELLAAALGALIGAFVTYRFALHLVRKQHELTLRQAAATERRAACASVRASLAPTLAFIYIARHHGTHDRPDSDTHIKEALLSHGAAVEVFRSFVTATGSDGYQQAWEQYRKAAAMGQNDRVSEEWAVNIDGYEVLLERHINQLLAFADA